MEVMVPKENNNDQVVMITKLYVENGGFIDQDADLIEFETSKTAVVLQSPVAGYVTFYNQVDDEVEVNSPVCRVDDEAPKTSLSGAATATDKTLPDKLSQEGLTFSRVASKLDKHNANLDGKYWVTSRMLSESKAGLHADSKRSYVDSREQDRKPQSIMSGDHGINKEEYKVTKTTMRKRSEISNLRISGGGEFQSTIGIEITGGSRLAKNVVFENSIQDLVCYESSKMLGNEYNDLNAFYISDSEIGIFNSVAAGISLDNDSNKLTVARIDDSGALTLLDIQDRLGSLFIQFEDGSLSPESLIPSSYTITDLSSTGATYILPLLNGAESLILGIVRKGYDSFGIYATFDHRVSSGLRVSHFLDNLKARIEVHFDSKSTVEGGRCDFCLKSISEELELGNRGLLCLSTPAGQKNICRNCYEGW
jgi:pyruvate/2-oxoglutarate dehydrogenase complex dihydrolipoamide acyltransferase (E2) component